MTALVLDRVVKRFGDFTAVDDLSFSVPEGGVFGFLGGNGAGKTTSVRMMLDILRPDAGRIQVLGRAPSRANAPRIGFLPEERGLYRLMTVMDTVVYFGRLKGMSAADAVRKAATLIERLGLSQWANTALDTLVPARIHALERSAPELVLFVSEAGSMRIDSDDEPAHPHASRGAAHPPNNFSPPCRR